jgi:DNA-binding transcriptional LysR family regulator
MLSEMRALSMFAEVGSIQVAAARLYLTQSAVTRQIQRLEQALGTSLLDRHMKPPTLTQAGLAIVERCRVILRDVADLKANFSPTQEPTGPLRIGVGYVLADDDLVECLHALGGRYPRIRLNIKTDWHHTLIEMVRQNQLDIAIIPKRPDKPLPSAVSGTVIGDEPLVFVTGRLFAPERVKKIDLAHLRWVVKPKETGTREILEGFLAQNSLPFEIASEVRDEGLQLSLVARGLGIALVTRRSLRRHPRYRELRTRTVGQQKLKLAIMVIRGSHLGCLKPAVEMLQDQLASRLKGDAGKQASR